MQLTQALVTPPDEKRPDFLGISCTSVLPQIGQETLLDGFPKRALLGAIFFNCRLASSMSVASNVYVGAALRQDNIGISASEPPVLS